MPNNPIESTLETWRPHPKQEQALIRPEFEVLFGGSRGGGKTDAGLVWLIGEPTKYGTTYLEHPRYRALVIRKNADDLADWIDRAHRFYKSFGVKIAYKPAVLRFPSGAIIRTGHLKDEQSYTKYMGQEFPRILIEELTQIPFERRYLQLIASCRSTVPDLTPQVFSTTNPGGLGHSWVKKRFVDPSEPMQPFKDPASGRSRIFIPARVDDNPTLMEVDPDYIHMLDALKETDEELWKAWRLGDWDTFAGQYFREFRRDLHVTDLYYPEQNDAIVGGMDWGRTHAFAFYLAVVKKVEYEKQAFYRATVFSEVWGHDRTPQEWAIIMKQKVAGNGLNLKDISWIRGDPAMFSKLQDNSMSIADQFQEQGIHLLPASNDRVPGWENFRKWLSIAPDGLPYLQFSKDCVNLIRTLPLLVHDELKVEDLDTFGEDDSCFCRHTKVLTKRGYIPIIDVNERDLAWTPLGWTPVRKVHHVGKKALYTFLSMKATSDHRFLTQDGFRQLKDLRETDRLWSVFISAGLPSVATPLLQIFPIKSILAVAQRKRERERTFFTALSGNSSMGIFQKIWRSTIESIDMIVTILKILRWSLVPSIWRDIQNLFQSQLAGILKLLGLMRLPGIKAKLEDSSINAWGKNRGRQNSQAKEFAPFVKENIRHFSLTDHGSAASIAKCQCLDEDEVYNLTTDAGMYTVQGVVVSNCDAVRYMLKHLKWLDAVRGAGPTPGVTKKKYSDPRNLGFVRGWGKSKRHDII